MHYFSFNYGDFSRKTAGLSEKHKLAYLYLVSLYYDQEAPIHNEPVRLAFKTGISQDEVYMILHSFFECRDDHWHDDKIDKAIVEYQAKQVERRKAGKKGAEARWKPKLVI